jgi:HPt (histidine-containing phosphotransfer) domain-containing protein
MVQQLQHCLSTHSQEIVCTHNLPGHLDTLSPGPFDTAFIDLKNPHFNTTLLIRQLYAHQPCHLIAVIARGQKLPSIIDNHPYDDILTTPILTSTIKKIIFQITASQQKHSAPALPSDFLSPLLTKTQQNKQLAQTLLERCFEDFPKQLSEIKTHVTQQNIEQLQNCAHKLNGSAAFCGFTTIQQAAQKLEIFAKNHTTNQLANALDSLEEALQSFLGHQDQLLEQLKD